MTTLLRRLLIEAEEEHKRLGLPADDWADWYAEYLTPRILGACRFLATSASADAPADGITEG